MFKLNKRKLFNPLIILIVLGLISLTIITGAISYTSVHDEHIKTMHQQNRALINRIEGWLYSKAIRVEGNALLLSDLNMDVETIIHYFGLQSEHIDDISIAFAGFPDGTLIFGGNWEVAHDLYVVERPWYIAAAERPGEVVFSRPYMGGATGRLAFAATRTVHNYDDSLGVVALSIPFENLTNFVLQESITEYSFRFIIDSDGSIIFHIDSDLAPIDDMTFQNISEAFDGRYIQMFEAIKSDGFYAGDRIIYLGTPMEFTDWYVIVGIPTMHIIRSSLPTIISLIATVVFSFTVLIGAWVLLHKLRRSLQREKKAARLHEKFVSASPFIMSICDIDLNLLLTNDHAVEIFDLSDKQEYIDNFFMFSPEFQPCGMSSKEKAFEKIKEAFSCEKIVRFEWMHQKLNGEPIPTEITLSRFSHSENFFVAAHTIDMRPIKAAIENERKYNELIRTILDSSPALIEIWDVETGIVDCNKKTLEVFGLSSTDEYINRYDEFSPYHQPNGILSKTMDKLYLDDALKQGIVRYEWMHQLQDGTPLPVEVTCVRAERDGKTIVIGYTHDLREIKNEIAKSRAADERASLMMDASPISCFMIKQLFGENNEVKFEPIDFNPAAIKLFGFSSKEEAFARFYEIFPVSEDEKMLEIVHSHLTKALGLGYNQFEYTHQTINGDLIPCTVTLVRVELQDNTALICFHNDMRSFIAAIDSEKHAHTLTQMFLDAAPFFVEIWNENLELIDCNISAVQMFEVNSKEEYIKNFFDLCPEYQPCGKSSKTKIYSLIKECFNIGYVRADWMHITSTGELLPTDLVFVCLERDGEKIAIGYSQDLRAITAASARSIKAEEESRTKTQFLSRMSHEIRTPMNSVYGIAEIELQKNIHNKEAEDAFLRILSSSRMLINIINDILDLSKVEAGKIEIVPNKYEIASLIADTLQLNLMYTGNKNVEFTLSINENLPVSLIGDEIRIKQILNNLLSNAFKYTSEGEVNLKFDMEQTSDGNDIMLIVNVSDTGQGMDNEQISQLFNTEFVRFNQEQNRAIEGTGLGMVISYSLVQLMGGNITVSSTVGEGTTFTISIPQKVHNAQAVGRELLESLQNFETAKDYMKGRTQLLHEPMPYGRVLVVDDVESNLYVIKNYLQPYRLSVETVDSGHKAIAKIEDGNEYDIIFMDHMMPGMDGLEATKILQGKGYRHPIVALTANATVGISTMFLENGFSDFISKPIDPSKLEACLMNLIKAKQPKEVIDAAKVKYLTYKKDDSTNISDRLRKAFLNDANKSIIVLECIFQLMQMESIEQGIYKLFTIQTHSVKSALNNIGKQELAEVARVLEYAGSIEDVSIIKARTPELLEGLREIIDAFS